MPKATEVENAPWFEAFLRRNEIMHYRKQMKVLQMEQKLEEERKELCPFQPQVAVTGLRQDDGAYDPAVHKCYQFYLYHRGLVERRKYFAAQAGHVKSRVDEQLANCTFEPNISAKYWRDQAQLQKDNAATELQTSKAGRLTPSFAPKPSTAELLGIPRPIDVFEAVNRSTEAPDEIKAVADKMLNLPMFKGIEKAQYEMDGGDVPEAVKEIYAWREREDEALAKKMETVAAKMETAIKDLEQYADAKAPKGKNMMPVPEEKFYDDALKARRMPPLDTGLSKQQRENLRYTKIKEQRRLKKMAEDEAKKEMQAGKKAAAASAKKGDSGDADAKKGDEDANANVTEDDKKAMLDGV